MVKKWLSVTNHISQQDTSRAKATTKSFEDVPPWKESIALMLSLFLSVEWFISGVSSHKETDQIYGQGYTSSMKGLKACGRRPVKLPWNLGAVHGIAAQKVGTIDLWSNPASMETPLVDEVGLWFRDLDWSLF